MIGGLVGGPAGGTWMSLIVKVTCWSTGLSEPTMKVGPVSVRKPTIDGTPLNGTRL